MTLIGCWMTKTLNLLENAGHIQGWLGGNFLSLTLNNKHKKHTTSTLDELDCCCMPLGEVSCVAGVLVNIFCSSQAWLANKARGKIPV